MNLWIKQGEKRDLLLAWLPLVLCLLIVLIQIILTSTTTLSAWKGGGFGMFSTIDKRALSCLAQTENGQQVSCRITFHGRQGIDFLNRTTKRSLFKFTTQSALQEIANAYLENAATLEPEQLSRELKDLIKNKETPVKLKAIKLEMWEINFDPETLVVKPVRMGIEATAGNWQESNES